jgi:hypothetical protein
MRAKVDNPLGDIAVKIRYPVEGSTPEFWVLRTSDVPSSAMWAMEIVLTPPLLVTHDCGTVMVMVAGPVSVTPVFVTTMT